MKGAAFVLAYCYVVILLLAASVKIVFFWLKFPIVRVRHALQMTYFDQRMNRRLAEALCDTEEKQISFYRKANKGFFYWLRRDSFLE